MFNFTTKNIAFLISCVSVPFFIFSAGAQTENPNIGKPGPELKVKEWATSKTISDNEVGGNPYVIEFWATWCPPCRKSIPHMNEISQRVEPFGTKIIGLSDEDSDKIEQFAEKMDMMYYVGVNADTGGLEYQGIPFAAVINSEREVEWAGHPMEPAFEKTVYKLTEQNAGKLQSAFKASRQKGPGAAYQELKSEEGDKAEKASEIIENNFQKMKESAQTKNTVEKYQSLKTAYDLYQGVPGSEQLAEALDKLEKDSDVKKHIKEQKPFNELEKQVQAITRKAEKIADDKSDEAAQKYYIKELRPILKDFVEKHPDHSKTPLMKKTLQRLNNQSQNQ